MKARRFYTDPLAAAWMGVHFGVHFWNGCEEASPDDAGHVIADLKESVISGMPARGKYYIHPDSLHLLEPCGGDMILNKAGWPKPVSKIEDCVAYWTEHGKYHGCSIHDCRIIQRNGKAFHWPEQESA